MQMEVSAELHIGEADHDMSTSNIWLNTRRHESPKGGAKAESSDCEMIGAKKKSEDGDDASSNRKKLLCLCAPTTHAGSFKCRLHRTIHTNATLTSTAQKPLLDSSSSTANKSFISRNMAYSRRRQRGNLHVQPQPQPQPRPLPRLSRFGRAVGAGSQQPFSTTSHSNQQFYETHLDSA